MCVCIFESTILWLVRTIRSVPWHATFWVLKIQTLVSETPERLDAINACYWRSPSTSMLTNSCGFDSRKVPEVEITWRAIRIKM
jgi:hypothetical protein